MSHLYQLQKRVLCDALAISGGYIKQSANDMITLNLGSVKSSLLGCLSSTTVLISQEAE